MSVKAISYECKEVGRKIKRFSYFDLFNYFLIMKKLYKAQKRSIFGCFQLMENNIKLNYLFLVSVVKRKFFLIQIKFISKS